MEAPTTPATADLTQARPVWFTMLYDAPRKGDDTISPDYKLYVAMMAKMISAGFVNMVHNYLNIPAIVEYNKGKDLYYISSFQEFYDNFDPSESECHRSTHLNQLASITRFVVVTKQNQLSTALNAIPVVPASYAINSPYVAGDNCLTYLDGDGEDLAHVLKGTRSMLTSDIVKLRRNVVETLLVEQELQKREDAVVADIRDVAQMRGESMKVPEIVGVDGKPLV